MGSKNRELIEKYNGMAMGNKDSKNIYMILDLGYTKSILNILKQIEFCMFNFFVKY